MKTAAKALAALAIAAVGWGASVVVSPSAAITAGEWIQLASAGLVAAGVYQIANQAVPTAE